MKPPTRNVKQPPGLTSPSISARQATFSQHHCAHAFGATVIDGTFFLFFLGWIIAPLATIDDDDDDDDDGGWFVKLF